MSAARRVLVIDPAVFDHFPVSDLVLDFIIRQGQTMLPELEVFVGAVTEIPGLQAAAAIYTKAHPTNRNWPGTHDPRELLAPSATDYYPSFFAYWKKAEAEVFSV